MKKKIAMFSYNRFLHSEKTNGWKDGKYSQIFLVQEPDGQPWDEGVNRSYGDAKIETATKCREAIEKGWQMLSSEINNLDKVVIYVGSVGAERAIELAHENGVPASKIIFVMCDCEFSTKTNMIRKCFGQQEIVIVPCDCGGITAMKNMFRAYMEHI